MSKVMARNLLHAIRMPMRLSLVILGLAAVLRLVAVLSVPVEALLTPRCGGCTGVVLYDHLAHSILEQQQYSFNGLPSAEVPPLYPIVLAATYRLAGTDNYLAMRLFQVVIGTGTVFMVGAIARLLFGLHVSLLAEFFVATNPFLLFYTAELQTETLFSFLAALGIYLCFKLRSADGRHWRLVLATGVVLGLTMLCRPTGLVLPIVWLAWLALVSRRHVVRWGGGVLLIAALTIVPWMARNATVFGRFIPISANGFSNIAGYYVMRGYELSYTGPPLPEQYDEYGAANPFSYLGDAALEDYSRNLVLVHCRVRPQDCASAWLASFLHLWSPFIAAEVYSLPVRVIAIGAYLPFLILGILGLGVAYNSKGRETALFFIMWLFAFMALNAIKVPEIRYRVTVVDPYLALFASVTLIRFWPATYRKTTNLMRRMKLRRIGDDYGARM